jgi:hypothetical protein
MRGPKEITQKINDFEPRALMGQMDQTRQSKSYASLI